MTFSKKILCFILGCITYLIYLIIEPFPQLFHGKISNTIINCVDKVYLNKALSNEEYEELLK